MIKKIFIYLSILILTNISSLKSNEVKIITKVGKQIITNIDIENEYKYLVSLNNSYQNLNKGTKMQEHLLQDIHLFLEI